MTIALIVLSLATPAAAQHADSQRLIISDSAISAGLERLPPAQSSRDSLKNGMIIGTVIGAIAMGAFAGWLCHELQEPGEPTCWRSVPIGALYGAAIGVAAGAGIDALATRGPQLAGAPQRDPQSLRRERD